MPIYAEMAPIQIADWCNMSLQAFTIKFDNRLAEISPPRADLIGPLLEFSERIPTRTRNGQIAWTTQPQVPWDWLDNGTICFPAGSVSRVASELRRLGHQVTLNDVRRRSGAGFAVDRDYHQSLQGYCRAVADIVLVEHSGLIRLPGFHQTAEATGSILRLLPKARAYIAVAANSERQPWFEALVPFVLGDVDILGKGRWDSSRRVVIGTYSNLKDLDPQDRDLLVVTNAITALGENAVKARCQYLNHRVFGFLPEHHADDSRTRLRLEALCGAVVFDATTTSGHEPVLVRFVEWQQGQMRLPDEPLAAKRLGIWRNCPRNLAIARLATILAAGDCSVLVQDRGSGDSEATITSANGTGRTVAIVVESPEHGREIQRLLPNWPLHTAEAVRPAAGATRTNSGFGGNGDRPGSIVTQLYAARNTVAADTVIWAAGGPKVLPLRLVAPTAGQHVAGDFTWVDVVDEFDALALADTNARVDEYRRLGWSVHVPAWLERATALGESHTAPHDDVRARRGKNPWGFRRHRRQRTG